MNPTSLSPGARQLLERALGPTWNRATAVTIESESNRVLRIEHEGQRFALRLPHLSEAVTRIDRTSELRILQVAAQAGLAPDVVGSDEVAGLLLTRWLDGETWTLARAREDQAIVAVARLLRRLHRLAPPRAARRVELMSLMDHYLALSRENGAVGRCQALRERARERLARIQSADPVLCHNDAHHLNLVEGERLWLIDWEYAGLNDASFDLAAFAGYHDLDASGTAVLLDAYGARGVVPSEFADWRWIFEYVWALWLLATAERSFAGGAAAAVLQRLLDRLQ
jgi:thiamine kinase-like enzyme